MIACIAIPYFAAGVERRDDAALAGESLIIGGRPWEPQPVFAYSREVAQQGVRPGMSLRQAHALSPHSRFLSTARLKYLHASGEVVDVLVDFSNTVEPEELWWPPSETREPPTAGGRSLPAHYYLDLDLPAQEAIPFSRHIGRSVRQETQLAPAIGLAPHKFAAQVAAALARPNHARPVAAGEEAEFLAGRSLSFLPLDKETGRRLRLLGVRTLGQFTALPLAGLREHFGPDIEPLYRLAQGRADVPLQPRPPEKTERVAYHFDYPIADTVSLAAVLTSAAAKLADRLQQAELAGSTLGLDWETDDGETRQQTIVLRQPTADSRHVAGALHGWMNQSEFTTGIVALTLTIGGLAPATARQLSLFPLTDPAKRIHQLAQPLVARYGNACFYQIAPADQGHPLPERRFQLHSL